ncbi:MAG: biosynthetic-type acetolactate synthase large subunit, partial [Butyricicoccus sp.]|nr:biosynthetic-type acetolactate synthase large subunit [Butyricicoccus sp.]
MKIRATQAIMECLLEQGVDTVFGYPGGTILNVYDELYRYQDKIRHILTAHEQGASHAADGYARSTGKVGVCFATSGPGATNLTTGIATAYLDSSPVVFLTCNVGENLLGRDAFQEVDITGIAMPITKATFLVTDPQTIPDVLRQAFAVASSGRPGPVLIDLLKNVTNPDQMVDYEYMPKEESRQSAIVQGLNDYCRPKKIQINPDDISIMLDMIAASEKPLIICGGGVVRGKADKQFREFAEKVDAPVAITLMGGGGFPGDHPLTTGMIGMHGSRASNVACSKCDLLIAIGCRFSDRVALHPESFATQAKIVQVDIDRAEIDKNVMTDHHIIGSARRVLEALNKSLPQYDHSEWKNYILPMRAPRMAAPSPRLTPHQILDVVREQAPENAIVATDVGQHQMWTAKYLRFSYPGQLLTSGGFGTMGFGLGAAIGAQVGNPDKRVIHVTGDG